MKNKIFTTTLFLIIGFLSYAQTTSSYCDRIGFKRFTKGDTIVAECNNMYYMNSRTFERYSSSNNYLNKYLDLQNEYENLQSLNQRQIDSMQNSYNSMYRILKNQITQDSLTVIGIGNETVKITTNLKSASDSLNLVKSDLKTAKRILKTQLWVSWGTTLLTSLAVILLIVK